ncbi:MAG TPA: 50S ribosomal protein L30 [Vicinamibacterales bacterium]|jgi:large subunit ribosomal protein L30|nr:50S ribosomal protein L30 [Vicinamibacterales bacterium]
MATKKAKKADGKRLKITLVKSTIGFNRTQDDTVIGLGLRRLNHTVELADTPETRGMIHKVRHLVTVQE